MRFNSSLSQRARYRKNPLTRRNPESIIQQQFFIWLELQFPAVDGVTCAIPNAGLRTPKNGARMKKEGLKAGMPDVAMFWPTQLYHGMFIEFKYGKNKPTDFQKAMIAKLKAQGYYCCICYDLESAIKEVKEYLR